MTVPSQRVKIVRGYRLGVKPWLAAVEKQGVYTTEVRAWTACGAVKKLADAQSEYDYDFIKRAKP